MSNHYARYQPASPWGQPFLQTVVGKLIVANVAVFFLQNIFAPVFTNVFALQPRLVVEDFFVWQLGSYMFLHGGFMHLLFNMFMLWIFGSTIESVWGARNFLRYYIVCGIGGGLLHMIVAYNQGVIGASGAVFGLYLAYAMMFPNNYIYLYFLFPIKAKYLVTGVAVLQLAQGISGEAGIAYFAHLGGMAAGLFFFRDRFMRRTTVSSRVGREHWWDKLEKMKRQSKSEDAPVDNIDSILDKISAKGYDNLTPTEKRILDNYSRQQRDDPE